VFSHLLKLLGDGIIPQAGELLFTIAASIAHVRSPVLPAHF